MHNRFVLPSLVLLALLAAMPAASAEPQPQGTGFYCGFSTEEQAISAGCGYSTGVHHDQTTYCGTTCDFGKLETHCWYRDGPGAIVMDCPLVR